jgi:hypothetical protein
MFARLLKLSSPLLVAVLAVGTASTLAPTAPTIAAAVTVDDTTLGMSVDESLFAPSLPWCPRMFTCDLVTFYNTRQQCETACGGPCEKESNCDPGYPCVCP